MSDFQTYLVKDNRLNVKSMLNYEVFKGGQNVTYSEIRSTSASDSQHVFNVIVPSQNTLIDRNVRWEASIAFQFTLTSTSVAAGVYERPVWGQTMGIQPFPLNQLCTTMTATINNNSVSIQSRDIVMFLLKMFTREELNSFQNTTPCMPDNYMKYEPSRNKSSNVLAGLENMTLDDLMPRGAFRLDYLNSFSANPSEANRFNIVDLTNGSVTSQTIYGQISVSEPLLLSPFLYNQYAKHGQAIYGVNNMNLTMNMGDASQLLKFPTYENQGTDATANTIVSNIQVSYKDRASLRLQYLTPHASDMLNDRNIVPYYTLNRFNYSCQAVAAARSSTVGNATLRVPVAGQVVSNVVNLNQIPDRFLIGVRATAQFYKKPKGCQFSQFFMPITKFNCIWNNNAGLFASASQRQLWKLSVDNGLRQSWTEWSGIGMSAGAEPPVGSGVDQDSLLGGFLVICPGKDLQIIEDWYAPGSIGQFNFQCTVDFVNTSDIDFADGDLELIVIPMMSGMFVLEKGTSAVYTAILGKELVTNVDDKNAYFSADVQRQIGGSFFDDIKTGLSDVASVVKPIADIAGPVISVAKMLGAGGSGGSNGAGVSGGRMKRHKK